MLVAVCVAAAYYVGVRVGLALTFPPATTSVLWPPNALLTAALLLVPVRSWWLCLAAALPVHVISEIGAGFSPLLVALLFLTNCSEALIAAGGLRLASRRAGRFDNLQDVALFIAIAGLLAPVVSSCFDAAIVTALRQEPYWKVWITRVYGNTLTELSVVPASVLAIDAFRRRQEWPNVRRVAEASVLGLGLVAVAAAVFDALHVTIALPGIPQTPTVFLLPFFLWAAVRFGVGGVSFALLASALVTSVSATTGGRPFGALPPLESLSAVQVYLSVIGAFSMCLAGLVEERRQAAATLTNQLRFEALLALISASFVRPPQQSLSSATSPYDDCLSRIGDHLAADRVVLLTAGPNAPISERLRHWRRQTSLPELAGRLSTHLPWAQSRLASGGTVVFESLGALPDDAVVDRQSFTGLGIAAAVMMPFIARDRLHGALLVASSNRRTWRDTEIEHIRLLAEVIANAGAREQAAFEIQRLRHELAQVARLVTMGELTSSLAHELNQPLTGILSNAQAATHHLEEDEPSLPELRVIVADIIDDNRRARDVISRMRDMLTRRAATPEPVDMNAVARDVAVLVTSETIIRNVSITLAFTSQPAYVTGVRIELQQALLNVLTNAMEAVADQAIANRLIDVRLEVSERHDATERGDVFVFVGHPAAGPGPDVVDTHVFERFFADQPPDSGMSLAVARSIIENHGGTIAADHVGSGDSVVTITLPLMGRTL